jgi:glyoxylase-like metal-dependent hydrolase (beta-lactamase superfamily II)
MTSLRRLTAPNPGPFTAEGTNTWLLGAADVLVIDPGPECPSHAAAILAALAPGARIAAILLTHAHADHAGGAMALSALAGAPVCGHPASGGPHDAAGLRIDRALAEGDSITAGEVRLSVLHTPGHHPGHLVFTSGTRAFCGDHVMGWATTVIAPPDGDMHAYMASLARPEAAGWRVLHPGHGPDIADPPARIAALATHRAARHAAVATALSPEAQRPSALLARVYPDIPQPLAAAATASLHAHLIALAAEGRAVPDGPPEAPSTRFRRP